ncbi:MAG: site-2 protease family protein [Candidatus Nealsonbacteria bacterium]|nr:site-2 protease family protein [Candidatus Nealsonbacteria bacterium]
MSINESDEIRGTADSTPPGPIVFVRGLVAEQLPQPPPPPAPHSRMRLLPALLFVATCSSTLFAGGWAYAGSVMVILACHEAGHFIQARRYGVYTSFPFFLPMPLGPLGTWGAVISMDPHIGDRRKLFDIGITGPLAGLVPTLVCCVVGMYLTDGGAVGGAADRYPPVLQFLAYWFNAPMPPGHAQVHPVLFAGWVGLLLTSLNLMPIGQLDGGHILYALLPKGAHRVAKTLLLAAIAAIILFEQWFWVVMLVLAILIGPFHPPTGDDKVPLGPVRIVLGWLTLAFILIGFTPNPIRFLQ